jgi:hypothetical protein
LKVRTFLKETVAPKAAPLNNLVIKNNSGFGFCDEISTLTLPLLKEKVLSALLT